jgi:hypothetical protein
MDQQEFVPRPQSEEQQSLDEEIDIPAQPYYWSTRPNTPKDEPTAHYDLPMVQSDPLSDYQNGYMAQDPAANSSQRGEKIDTSRQLVPSLQEQRQKFGHDADAYEFQYQPYKGTNQRWSAPVFGRSRRRSFARWPLLIVLGAIFLGTLMPVLGALLAVAGAIILILLFSILLVLLVIIPLMLFRIRRGIGGAGISQRRWRYNNNWRGPWGW